MSDPFQASAESLILWSLFSAESPAEVLQKPCKGLKGAEREQCRAEMKRKKEETKKGKGKKNKLDGRKEKKANTKGVGQKETEGQLEKSGNVTSRRQGQNSRRQDQNNRRQSQNSSQGHNSRRLSQRKRQSKTKVRRAVQLLRQSRSSKAPENQGNKKTSSKSSGQVKKPENMAVQSGSNISHYKEK